MVALCRELGWLVNKEKSELDPKQVFNCIHYQFDLKEGRVRPTPERWQALTDKIQTILSSPVCTDCTGLAQHALVLGSRGNFQSDPIVSAQSAQSGDSAIQPDPAQESVKPEPTCLAPRATTIKEQGFSEVVAARIEAPQRGSTMIISPSMRQSGPFLQSVTSVIR